MKSLLSLIVGAVVLFSAESARACSTCMGSADLPIAPAMNASIMFLLGLLIVMLTFFVCFIVYLARRDGLHIEHPAPANSTSSHRLYA